MNPFLYGTLITTLYIVVAVGIMFIYRFYGVLRYGAENGGRNEYVYNDLYGADRIGRSYYDTPGNRV